MDVLGEKTAKMANNSERAIALRIDFLAFWLLLPCLLSREQLGHEGADREPWTFPGC